jgi:hypothetical protein
MGNIPGLGPPKKDDCWAVAPKPVAGVGLAPKAPCGDVPKPPGLPSADMPPPNPEGVGA